MANHKCPDCGHETEQVTIIDKAGQGGHATLEYRAVDSQRSIWTGRHATKGAVASLMCTGCRRIFLYAWDYQQEADRRSDAEQHRERE